MRRITAVGLSALALCGVIGTTAGTANADAAVGRGAAQQAADPKPVGKKHFFHFSIPGSDVAGVWYAAMNGTNKQLWLKTTVRHTKADAKQAAFCWKIDAESVFHCLPTSKAKGSTASLTGFADTFKHISMQAALGHGVKKGKKKIFLVTDGGAWYKIF